MVDNAKHGPMRKLDIITQIVLNEGCIITFVGIILFVSAAWWIALVVFLLGVALIVLGLYLDTIDTAISDEINEFSDGYLLNYRLMRLKEPK